MTRPIQTPAVMPFLMTEAVSNNAGVDNFGLGLLLQSRRHGATGLDWSLVPIYQIILEII